MFNFMFRMGAGKIYNTKGILNCLSIICIITLVFGLFFTSCSSRTIIELDEEGVGGKVTTSISFAPFFTEYLRDLIGFRAFSDIIDLNQLKKYFEKKESVSNVYTSVSNDPESIVVYLETSDVIKFIKSMKIPYKIVDRDDDQREVKIQVTKDFIKEIVSQLPVFQKIGTEALFVFDSGSVSKIQFPNYISWALSDYETPAIIKTTVEKSSVIVTMKKQTKNAIIPDVSWQRIKKDTQQKKISFINIMYEDKYNLSYTY